MRSIPISEATPAQLREFARVQHGLDISNNAQSGTVIAKLRAAGYEKDEIVVPDEPAAPQAAVSPADFDDDDDLDEPPHERVVPGQECCVAGLEIGSRRWEKSFCEIMIPKTNEPGGREPVRVAVNGRALLIARGIPQRIRAPYLEALMNAVGANIELDENFRIEHVSDVTRHTISVRKLVGAA